MGKKSKAWQRVVLSTIIEVYTRASTPTHTPPAATDFPANENPNGRIFFFCGGSCGGVLWMVWTRRRTHIRIGVTIALAMCLLLAIPGVEGKKKKKSNKAAAAAEAAGGQGTAQSGGKTGGGAGGGGSTGGYADEEDPKNQVATQQ
jgi:uncharacterized membrane protein YgcG